MPGASAPSTRRTARSSTPSSPGIARFYGAIKRDRNANNVCGVSPIFLTMELLAHGRTTPLRGEQFGYATCPADDANTSVVTVCGLVFS
ncbi:MAG: hypothetical protein R3A10_03965 [Caldilineaceae bacterium]